MLKDRRSKLAAIVAASALGAGGIAVGAVATNNGDNRASDLATAINARAHTSLTVADVQGALADVLKARLAADVKAGRLTQAEADEILKNGGRRGLWPGHDRPGHHGGEVFTAVAKALKLSESDLRTKLEGGSTLAKVAADASVSRADLLTAITKALKAERPNATAAELATQAAAIADGTRPERGFGPGGPGGPRDANVLAPVAKLFKLTEVELRTKLQAGSTLAKIAEAQGVSRADLLAAITTVEKLHHPNATAAELAAHAAAIADATRGPGGRGPDGHPVACTCRRPVAPAANRRIVHNPTQ